MNLAPASAGDGENGGAARMPEAASELDLPVAVPRRTREPRQSRFADMPVAVERALLLDTVARALLVGLWRRCRRMLNTFKSGGNVT